MKDKFYLFVGRWSPFHNGHKYIIDTFVKNGEKVCIAIRDTEISIKDPFTFDERKRMITSVYKEEIKKGQVKIIRIPDIMGICTGRNVGYFIFQVPEHIKRISGTNVREADFKFDLPDSVKKIIEEIKK
jgi:adenylylsulfate kinase